jgi:MFS family permease
MLLFCLSLVAMAAHPPTSGLLLIELAVAGSGLGMFTPPNNAAIMGASPRQQAGMASGILNMTRGLGTSLGVALTGLVFGLAAGTSAAHATAPGSATRGLVAAALFLAAASFLAAVLAALRGSTGLSRDPTLVVAG